MLITATFATAAILGAYITGRPLLNDQPNLAADADVAAHQEYATRLVLPTIGFWVMATLTGFSTRGPASCAWRCRSLLAGFAIVVLILVILSGDADARSLWDSIQDQFTGG